MDTMRAPVDEDGFLPIWIESHDGLRLYGRDYGSTEAGGILPPVICLPGLTRNSRDFHPLALRLSRDTAKPRRVITIDSRGRGNSDRDPDPSHYNLAVEAQDVLTVCQTLDLHHADFIGTSRGGLLLHFLPAMQPSLPRRIVLNDIGPLIELEGLRLIRDYLGGRATISDWRAAADALKATHGAAFPILEDEDWAQMAEAIHTERDGVIEADFDPEIARQLQAADLDGPLPDLWTQFETLSPFPVMVVRGALSRLLSPQTVERMRDRHPDLTVSTAAGQGHAPLLHLEPVFSEIAAFLARP